MRPRNDSGETDSSSTAVAGDVNEFSVEAKEVADSLADSLRISAQVDKRMHNDAARFNGIEQAKASGADHKAPHRLFKHRRHLGMDLKMTKREIEFASEAGARSLSVLFKLGKDLEQVVLCALLPNDFRHEVASTVDLVRFPNGHRFRDRHDDRLVAVEADLAVADPCPAQEPLD